MSNVFRFTPSRNAPQPQASCAHNSGATVPVDPRVPIHCNACGAEFTDRALLVAAIEAIQKLRERLARVERPWWRMWFW